MKNTSKPIKIQTKTLKISQKGIDDNPEKNENNKPALTKE
jgi:hypothetical protein